MLTEKGELIKNVAVDIRKLSETDKMFVLGIMQGMLAASADKQAG